MNKEDWNFEALRFLLQNTYTDDEANKMNLLNISDKIIADETVDEEISHADRTYDALKEGLP